MSRTRFLAGLLCIGLVSVHAIALATTDDIQLWPTITLNRTIGKHWGAHLTTRLRFDDDVSDAKDILVRPSFSFSPHEVLVLDLGYDFLHSFDGDDEHRPWQSIEQRIPIRNIVLRNRVRIDERFIDGVDGMVLRLRYRLRLYHRFTGSDWYTAVSDEVFGNVNDPDEGPVAGFEQNRLRFAFGRWFPGRMRVESGYEWQFVESRSSPSENRHVFFVEFSIDTGSGPPRPPWSPR